MAADASGRVTDVESAVFIYQLLLAASLLGNVVSSVVGAVVAISAKRARAEVQRREVTFGQEYATRDELRTANTTFSRRLDAVEQGVQDLRSEFKDEFGALRVQHENTAVRIHQRIDTLGQDLHDMPQKIVAMLANTGVLHPRKD